MRRLLRFGVVLLILTAFLTPLAEFFDSWDTAGLDNDTELPLFALVLALSLVLLVCNLVSSRAALTSLIGLPLLLPACVAAGCMRQQFQHTITPGASPPLRI